MKNSPKPNYRDYTLEELYEAEASIDREKYPERYNEIRARIQEINRLANSDYRCRNYRLTEKFLTNQSKARKIETVLLIIIVLTIRLIKGHWNIELAILNFNFGVISSGFSDTYIFSSSLIAYFISLRTTIVAGKTIGFSFVQSSLFLGGLALVTGLYEGLRLLIYLLSSYVLYQIYVDIPIFVLVADWLSLRYLKALYLRQNNLLTEETKPK